MSRARETARQRRRREQDTRELVEAAERAGNPSNWTAADLLAYLDHRGIQGVDVADTEALREAVRQDIAEEADELPWDAEATA